MRLFGRGKPKDNQQSNDSEQLENTENYEVFRADDFRDSEGMENTIITEALANVFRQNLGTEELFNALREYNSGTQAYTYWVMEGDIEYALSNFEGFYEALYNKFQERLANPKPWKTETTYKLVKEAFGEF